MDIVKGVPLKEFTGVIAFLAKMAGLGVLAVFLLLFIAHLL
jgi:hypothetical protein